LGLLSQDFPFLLGAWGTEETLSGSRPEGQPGRVEPVAPASTTSATSPPESSATESTHVAGSWISGAETCRSTCHRPHTHRTCSISTWHNQAPFSEKISLVLEGCRTSDNRFDCMAALSRAAPCIHNGDRHIRRRVRRRMDRPYDLCVDLVPNHVLSRVPARPDPFHLLWT